MKRIILLYFILVTCSFLYPQTPLKKVSRRAKLKTRELTASISNELCNKYQMKYIGCGAGMNNGIDHLSLSFEIKGPLPKEKLRNIALYCYERYYNALNRCKDLKPFLIKYPLPPESVSITIGVDDKHGSPFVKHPNIDSVSIVKSNIIYRTKDRLAGFKTEIEEPLPETTRANISDHSEIFQPKHNKFRQISKVAKDKAHEVSSKVVNTLCKRHNLRFIGFGAGMFEYINMLELSFNIDGPLEKFDIRKIIVDCMQEYHKAINSCKEMQADFVQNPFPIENTQISIGIHKEGSYERVSPPLISHAFCQKGKIYYTTSEHSILKPIPEKDEESLEEAKEIITNNVN